jgi:hypothetical protein
MAVDADVAALHDTDHIGCCNPVDERHVAERRNHIHHRRRFVVIHNDVPGS